MELRIGFFLRVGPSASPGGMTPGQGLEAINACVMRWLHHEECDGCLDLCPQCGVGLAFSGLIRFGCVREMGFENSQLNSG
jgi:hypothetical protein